MSNARSKWIVTVVCLCLISACEARRGGLSSPEVGVEVTSGTQMPPSTPSDASASADTKVDNRTAWPAKYSGTLPCADCPGIETTLVLIADGTYQITETYLGRGIDPFGAKGRISWNAAGDIITLDSAGGRRAYKVEEDALRALDRNGQIIDGELAEYYILKSHDTEFSGAYVWGEGVHVFSACDSDNAYWVMATTGTTEKLLDHYKLKSTKAYQALFIRFRGHVITDQESLAEMQDYDGLIRINELLDWDAKVPAYCRGR